MFRKAKETDIDAIAAIYEKLHDREASGQGCTGWIRGVYPTRETALNALAQGDLYVEEENGTVVAAARINQEQVPEYANCPWAFEAPPEQIFVLHTLVVDPEAAGRGYGSQFVAFYEEYGREQGCTCLRLDTNARNLPARALYKKLGYREAGIVPCDFNGIPGISLVCLEKRVEQPEKPQRIIPMSGRKNRYGTCESNQPV